MGWSIDSEYPTSSDAQRIDNHTIRAEMSIDQTELAGLRVVLYSADSAVTISCYRPPVEAKVERSSPEGQGTRISIVLPTTDMAGRYICILHFKEDDAVDKHAVVTWQGAGSENGFFRA